MRIVFSLEPECEHPWRANYEGFTVPGYTAPTALLKNTSTQILGHQTRTYEHLLSEIAHDLPRSNLKKLPELIFSDNISEPLSVRTHTFLEEKISLQSSQSL